MGERGGWQSQFLGPISNSFLLGPGVTESQGSRFPYTSGPVIKVTVELTALGEETGPGEEEGWPVVTAVTNHREGLRPKLIVDPEPLGLFWES